MLILLLLFLFYVCCIVTHVWPFSALSGFISELLKSLHQKQEDLSESEPFNFGLIFFLKVSIVTIFLLLFSPQLSLVFFLLSASQYWWPKRVKHASQCNKRKTKKAAINMLFNWIAIWSQIDQIAIQLNSIFVENSWRINKYLQYENWWDSRTNM
jgi:hypothetical protein